MPDHGNDGNVAALIAAAGSSRRMKGRDKLWLPLAGRLVLARSIDVFESSPLIDIIVLVVNPERVEEAATLCHEEGWDKVAAVVAGGERRRDSVRNGLAALANLDPQTHWVMIHDGARPLVTPALLEAGLQAAREHQAAIAAVPVKDTIKRVERGLVHSTIERSTLYAVQTPQVFSFPLIYAAHTSPEAGDEVTDDAALLERLGHPVAVFPGSYANLKITTPEDILVAEALLQGGEPL
jgi:2-C-methyl-D-erythritol 4-phosphate cytidylyltransferase